MYETKTSIRPDPDVLLSYCHKKLLHDSCFEASLRIENYDLICRHFGDDAARQVKSQVLVSAKRALGSSGMAAPGTDGVIDLVVWGPACGEGGAPVKSASWMEDLTCNLAMAAVPTGSGTVHARIGVAVHKGDAFVGDGLIEPAGGDGPKKMDGESRTFRSDMAAVTPLLSAIRAARQSRRSVPCPEAGILWRPVGEIGKARALATYEASLGLIETNGHVHGVEPAIAAAERLGFAPLVDRYLVSGVIDELLNASPSVAMSVTVSVSSLRHDQFWRDKFSLLEARKTAASRLIVEVRDSSDQRDWSEAQAVISCLRSLGCRLSISGFGTGASALRYLVALRPDFITVDRQFLADAGLLDPDERALVHLVGLAKALGAEVAIDGVDSERASAFAAKSGAVFQKGPWLGSTRICRPWVAGCAH